MSTRSAAVPDIGLPEMLVLDPTFAKGHDRQQCGVDFEDRGTRQRPDPVIATSSLIPVMGRAKFLQPDGMVCLPRQRCRRSELPVNCYYKKVCILIVKACMKYNKF